MHRSLFSFKKTEWQEDAFLSLDSETLRSYRFMELVGRLCVSNNKMRSFAECLSA